MYHVITSCRLLKSLFLVPVALEDTSLQLCQMTTILISTILNLAQVGSDPLLVNHFVVVFKGSSLTLITRKLKYAFSSLPLDQSLLFLAQCEPHEHIKSAALPDEIDKIHCEVDLSLAKSSYAPLVAADRIGVAQSQRIDDFLKN